MRIALISDIHYGKLATSHEFAIEGEPLSLGEIQNAKPLLQGAINILKNKYPDYLIIAGDLTSTGSPLEFKYCYQAILSLGQAIGVDSSKIFFCMGNHDVDWRITRLIDAYSTTNKYKNDDVELLKNFYQSCASSVSKDILSYEEYKHLHPNYTATWEKPFSGVIEDDSCVFFVLNSSYMSSHDQELKHGVLSVEQLSWFSKQAVEYKSINKFKIVLLHHHPYAYQNLLPSLDPSILEESGELSNICGNNGIELILHGHKHQPQAKTINQTGWLNPVTYICAGSLSVNVSERQQTIPNTLHFIDYHALHQIELKNYSYTPEDGWFPTKYCAATPVDDTMYLGKIPDINSVEKTIQNLPHNKSIEYDFLSSQNDNIKYITREILSQLIKKMHPTCELYQKDFDSFIIFSYEESNHE